MSPMTEYDSLFVAIVIMTSISVINRIRVAKWARYRRKKLLLFPLHCTFRQRAQLDYF
jgi:hypothetical protein